MVSDPIADLLIRIKNAYLARNTKLRVGYSKVKSEILEILKDNGYIKDYKVEEVSFPSKKDKTKKEFKLELLYFDRKPVLEGVVRISKPGMRVYEGKDGLKSFSREVGVTVVSTPKGLMTISGAISKNLGGEILFRVW